VHSVYSQSNKVPNKKHAFRFYIIYKFSSELASYACTVLHNAIKSNADIMLTQQLQLMIFA